MVHPSWSSTSPSVTTELGGATVPRTRSMTAIASRAILKVARKRYDVIVCMYCKLVHMSDELGVPSFRAHRKCT